MFSKKIFSSEIISVTRYTPILAATAHGIPLGDGRHGVLWEINSERDAKVCIIHIQEVEQDLPILSSS